MSRFRRAIHGVASSYVLLAAVAVYSLTSIPVALHYLDKERFGLWALMGSLVGYLGLIDAGMSSSAARLIVDHKDDRNGGQYGGLIKTGWLVSLVQGAIILVTGLVFANSFARLLAIPAELQSEFIRLVDLQCSVVALSFATRILSLILTAHQRMDLVNYTGTLSLVVNFVALWLFFHFGFGVLSLAWAGLCATVVAVICQWLACEVLKLFPGRGGWGRASWFHFKEIFAFGKDVFLVSVGTQLILTSQSIIITRKLGLEAAAAWSVGTKTFSLINQAIARVGASSWGAFSEMMVRGESERLRERYRNLVILVASLSAFAAVSFALCNSLFVAFWTSGRISWPPMNDLLLGVWLIVLSVQSCHSNFILATKQIGFMRFIFFIEGAVFVGLAVLMVSRGGLPALIACSVFCGTAFTGAYGAWRASRYFGFAFGEVAFRWLKHAGRVLMYWVPLALLCWWGTCRLGVLPRLVISSAWVATFGLYILLRFGIPTELQLEFQRRAPAKISLVLARIFDRPSAGKL
jgi:O-antigen/teichoic acid export membrane protein